METMPYIDYLFGNESEAITFAEGEGWATKDIAEIAVKISAFPKASGHRGRIVVITQGPLPTVIAKDGRARMYPVTQLAASQLVDTNGELPATREVPPHAPAPAPACVCVRP